MAQPSNTRKIAISLALPFAFFGGLELILVLAGFSYRPDAVPIVIRTPAHGDGQQEQRGIFRSDPLTLWSPRPGAVIPWEPLERVNAAGFRGPELPLERTPGVLRVATLGDSSTFGLRLPGERCYAALLEGLLAERGLRAEVLNAGVIGFTISQGLERYRHHVRPYQPDVVVAAFSAINEHHAALESDERRIESSQAQHAAREGERGERARVAQLAAWVACALRGGAGREREQLELTRARMIRSLTAVGEPGWPETRRVSVERFAELARALAREVEADGAALLLVQMPRRSSADAELPVLPLYSEALRAVAAELDLPLCDAQRAFRALEPPSRELAPLFFPGDRWHPNAEGHAVIAQELAPLIEAAAAGGGP